MKSIQINGQFAVLDFHAGAVLSSRVDYDVVKLDGGRFLVPRSLEPIIFLEKMDGMFRAFFFNGAEWSGTESALVDADDPVEALVTVVGRFFPNVTSRGNRVFLRSIKQWRVPASFISPGFLGALEAPAVLAAAVENAPIAIRA